jgi:hypothetical protein
LPQLVTECLVADIVDILANQQPLHMGAASLFHSGQFAAWPLIPAYINTCTCQHYDH